MHSGFRLLDYLDLESKNVYYCRLPIMTFLLSKSAVRNHCHARTRFVFYSTKNRPYWPVSELKLQKDAKTNLAN